MSNQPVHGPLESRRERVKRGAIGAGAAVTAVSAVGGGAVLFAPPAAGAAFSVTNTNDSGAGSLRQAVEDADAAAGADTITFSPAVTGAIVLTSGEISIDDAALTIQGPGASRLAIDGNNASRLFTIPGGDANRTTVISGLTLRNGNAGSGSGGAIRMTGTGGTLTLSDSVVSGNEAGDDGGALYTADGTVNALNTVFTGNAAGDDGGSAFLDANQKIQTWRNVTISGNTAGGDGGGIMFYSLYNATLVENSTISGNTAGRTGGGVYLYKTGDDDVPSGSPSVVIRGTTISGNTAVDGGGGVYFDQDNGDFERAVRFENSTISGNTSTTGPGGGVYLPNTDLTSNPEGTVTFDSTTVVNNSAPNAGGLFRKEAVTLTNSIVANNANADLGDSIGATGAYSLAFSLVENAGTAAASQAVPGSNLLGVDPRLGPLASNGGPTRTHLPLAGSPVRDAGSTSLTVDQRGLTRPFQLVAVPDATAPGADGSDIGAAEVVITAKCGGRTATIVAEPGQVTKGTAGKDVIVGTSGADRIKGLGGNDVVCGKGGNDKIAGGGGKDTLRGQGGNDKINGGGANDKLIGGGGKDTLAGNAGNDTLKGGAGDDTLKGGPGKDVLLGGGGKNTVVQRRVEDVLAD
jgi:Ca2+-binding RTX toxin-like protein